MNYVDIRNIHKKFNEGTVLDDLSLTVEKGEFVTLLGPSGCGKSTLLRCIAGLEDIQQGSIHIDGKDITSLPAKERGVGMVFQSYALFPNMSVYDNIAFGLKMRKVGQEDIDKRVKEILSLVDLISKIQAFPHQLSGGQQQRVALARSLVTAPKILLLDEPLSALDAKIRKNLRSELRNIQQELKTTMIFVTHDQEEALTLSDRIFIMDQGRIVQTGSPDDIYRKPTSAFVAGFIGNYNILSQIESHRLLQWCPEEGHTAIRPEVIQLQPWQENHLESFSLHEGWKVKGKVLEITVKGNILRYDILANDVFFHVEMLNNRQQSTIYQGMDVAAYIPKEECIPLI